jgi:hypothetical protein
MSTQLTMDARLRLVPVDPPAYRRAHTAALRQLARARADGTISPVLLRQAGIGHLALRQLAAARRLLTEAAALADTPRRRVAALRSQR